MAVFHLLCFYHILTSSVIYYLIDARQHGMYLLIEIHTRTYSLLPSLVLLRKLTNSKSRITLPRAITHHADNGHITRQGKPFATLFYMIACTAPLSSRWIKGIGGNLDFSWISQQSVSTNDFRFL